MTNRWYPEQITWWSRSAVDGYGGETFSSPVVIGGRWEEKNELFMNRAGEEEVSQAIAYIDRAIEVGDYLMYGVSNSNNPTLVDAYEVKKYNRTPDLRTIRNLHKAFM